MRRLSRTALFPLVVIVLLVYLAGQTLLPDRSAGEREELAYGELIELVGTAPDQIAAVLFVPKANGIEVTFADGREAETHYPTDASQVRFQELLERQGIAFDSRGTGASARWSILTYLLPFALFFGFWIFLMHQVKGTSWPFSRRRRAHPDLPDESAGS